MRKTFRYLLLVVSFVLMHSTVVGAHEWLDIVRVQYEKEQTFKRISEYLTGEEYQGRRMIVRNPENERAGMYWKLQLRKSTHELPEKAQLKVSYFRKNSSEIESRTYAISNERSVYVIYAGVTGSDWIEEESVPSAWKIELLDAEGKCLDMKQSFLWEYPVGKKKESSQ